MSDEIELLREFLADTPTPTVETRRRIYASATRRSQSHSRLRALMTPLRRLGVPAEPSSHPRALRWGIGLAALLLAVGGAAAYAVSASGDPPVSSLVSQVQESFGDRLLVSGSVSGPTLTVTVASSDEPSSVSATFEAQILAYSVRDAQAASGQTPISSVQYAGPDGNTLLGYGLAPVGIKSVLAPLAQGACRSGAIAADAADASLSVMSALTLDYGGGACAFRFQTTDPATFAANAPTTIGALVNAIGDPNQRPYLVRVDDQAGTPQFVASYTPNAGGAAFIKPGLSTSFIAGGGKATG